MSHVQTALPDTHRRRCRTCAHHAGEQSGGVWCDLSAQVCAEGMACVFWMRATGAGPEEYEGTDPIR